ncbi:trigger factor [Chloroflexota bacterium]
MKVTREKTENCQVFLTIEMEPAEVEESLEVSYHRMAKKTNVPGFRKGKAPRAVLERYIGKEGLLKEALDSLLPQAYEKAIEEQKIEAIAHPSIEITQTDPLIFKATVPLLPTIKLGDYHHIQVTPQPVELTDDKINDVMEQLRHQQATWEPIERPIDFGDLLVLDIESDIEGKPFINQKGVQYQVLRDSHSPVPGFAEQLLGMKRSEDKEFKLQFSPDHSRGELAGKELSFKVRVIEIKQERLPELNDAFAKQTNPEFETIDSLRERVSTNLRLGAEERVRLDFEEQVVEAVVGLTELEFPPVLADMEIEHLVNEESRRFQMGGTDLEGYLKSINKTEEKLREELHPLAIKRVSQTLILDKIAEEEKIEVSDSEISAEVENLVQSTTENKDKLQEAFNSPQAQNSIKQLLIRRKTIQRLAEIARGSAVGADISVDSK